MSPRTPLLRPDRYFADRDPTIPRLGVVFLVLLAAGPAIVYGVGWVLTANVDGTLLVDNPRRPPDWACEDPPSAGSAFAESCDEPRQLERDVDAVLWAAVGEYVGPAFLGFPLAVLVLTGLLHGGVKLFEPGRGRVRSLTLAAWGTLPAVVVAPVALVGLAMAIDPVTVSPGDDPAAVLEAVRRGVEAAGPFTSATTVIAAVWGGVIWRFGLVHQHALDATEATLVAGVVALVTAAFGVA